MFIENDPSAPLTQRGKRRQFKQDLILEAGKRMLLLRGYGNSSMDDVARDAGVSKATLYAIFNSKADLFAAVVAREGELHIGLKMPDVDTPEQLREFLIGFGTNLLELLLSPGTIAAYRSVASEASKSPDLGRIFYNNGPNQVLTRLGDFLERAMTRGLLATAPSRMAAIQFIELIRGDLYTRCMLGMSDEITAEEKATTLRSGVEVFLNAYAVRNQS